MFLDFSARYVFWLSYYAPSQHLNYSIELDLEFDLDLENQNLCSLSWSFREVSQQQIWQDGGFKDFGSDVLEVFTLITFRSESGFDSKLKVFWFKALGDSQDWSALISFGPAGCSRSDLCLQFFLQIYFCLHFFSECSLFLIIVPNLEVHNFFCKWKKSKFLFLVMWFVFANFSLLYRILVKTKDW